MSGIAAAAGRPAVPAKQPSFECTLTLLMVWAQVLCGYDALLMCTGIMCYTITIAR